MKIYMVGGAVRDGLLGLPVQDRDWVVVGATPEQLAAQGYLPVGRDFPVFLHPDTREEYALARTERKSGRGYRGFVVQASPEVTLEEDLARRDLTINAIAAETGADGRQHLIDPYGGQRDIRERVLRHVAEAFREDPVRILRLARFAARLQDFRVAPETMALMREMVAAGETDHLVPERMWQEVSRGLMARRPSRMFEVLRACGALQVLLPEIDALWGVPQCASHPLEMDAGTHTMRVLDMAARLDAPLAVRFACLCHNLGKAATPAAPPADAPTRHASHINDINQENQGARLVAALCERLRVPQDCRDLVDLVAREHGNIHTSGALDADALARLFERCDAWRKPDRFSLALLACECAARGRPGHEDDAYPQRARLAAALAAALAVPTAPIAQEAARQGLKGPQIGERILAARITAVAHTLAG